MSNKQRILYEIETYDTGKLSEFLEANGLEEFTQVVQIKNLDGPQFLNIREYEILSWKPHITLQQVRKLWAFIIHFKENPDKYVIPRWKFPRPNITRQQLEYLCNDEQIINKLHNLLQERDLQQATTQDSSDNQESFSSEDEAYVNHETVINQMPNKSSLHKLSFKDPTKDLKPITNANQKFDIPDSEEVYENASNLPQIKSNPVKEMHIPTQIKVEEETEEMYENRPTPQPKKEIGIPVLPRPPLQKLPKPDEPETSKCNLGSQMLPRPPLCRSFDLNKEIASTPTKLKPLPQIPQNDQNQPPVPLRSTKPDQTTLAVSINKNTSQFLDARSHLETVLSGRVSPKKEELEEYLEPNPVEEEEMYEPEPSFQENQSKNKLTRLGAIQALPLPPLPIKLDLKSPEPNSKNQSGPSDTLSRSSNKREIQSRALPKPPSLDFEQTPQAGTLTRPPRRLPNFNSHLNAQSENDLESLLCYRYTDRKGSEMLLTDDLGDGAYLFRPSKQYYCTLSVRCEHKIYHIGIKQNNEGQLECLSSGRHIFFDNLKEICLHFKTYPLRMIDNYNNYKSILLRDVLPRDRT